MKRRLLNVPLWRLLNSNVSGRRAATLLGTTKATVARKLCFLGEFAQAELLKEPKTVVEEVQFDELETFEHTKLKPVSVPLAVDANTRRIIAFDVCRMPAKGLLVERSIKKYGPRVDERPQGLSRLIEQVAEKCQGLKLVRSDSNPHYPAHVKRWLPDVPHRQEIGREGCIVGQGELKKVGFDPLFSLNHTCAMLRANLCRLIRKTWCTTKKPERLAYHLAIYVQFHNRMIQVQARAT